MKLQLVSVPELVLQDLLLNLELITAGSRHPAVERQLKTIWAHMPESKFNHHAESSPEKNAEIIDLFTGKTL